MVKQLQKIPPVVTGIEILLKSVCRWTKQLPVMDSEDTPFAHGIGEPIGEEDIFISEVF